MARIIAAWLAAFALAAPAAAQQAPEPPQPTYALVQLSVSSGAMTPGQFRKRTEALRSCEEAVSLATEIGAEVVRNARVTPERLPPQLRPVLKDLPVGHATQVFSGSGGTLRVLVLCQRG